MKIDGFSLPDVTGRPSERFPDGLWDSSKSVLRFGRDGDSIEFPRLLGSSIHIEKEEIGQCKRRTTALRFEEGITLT